VSTHLTVTADRLTIIESMSKERSNEALHRTAICAWCFALEFLVFICQFVAVGELGRSAAVRPRSI